MIENLETLGALNELGTMSRASTRLRISQSAVSKRIAALESHSGLKLIEREGRRVRLTPAGVGLLNRTSPLLSELRVALSESFEDESLTLQVGVSESILATWGASLLTKLGQRIGQSREPRVRPQGELQIVFHAHRSPLVYERVESGLYDLGICAGQTDVRGPLISENLTTEGMVLVSGDPGNLHRSPIKGLLSIESQSATWKSIKEEVLLRGLEPERELESFFAIAALAQADQRVGLVPLGVARALGFREDCIHRLRPKLERPIRIVYRKSKLQRPLFFDYISSLKQLAGRYAPRT